MTNGMMKGSSVLIGLLALVAVAGVWAEEMTLVQLSPMSFAATRNFADIDTPADGEGGDYSSSERARMIWLNFLFGAGSYSAGRVFHGVTLTLLQSGGITLLVLPTALGMQSGLSEQGRENAGKPTDGSSSNPTIYDDDLTYESNVMAWMYAGGVILLVFDIVLSIRWPLLYQRAPTANHTAGLANPQNWGFSLFPDRSGNLAGNLSFTAHF